MTKHNPRIGIIPYGEEERYLALSYHLGDAGHPIVNRLDTPGNIGNALDFNAGVVLFNRLFETHRTMHRDNLRFREQYFQLVRTMLHKDHVSGVKTATSVITPLPKHEFYDPDIVKLYFETHEYDSEESLYVPIDHINVLPPSERLAKPFLALGKLSTRIEIDVHPVG